MRTRLCSPEWMRAVPKKQAVLKTPVPKTRGVLGEAGADVVGVGIGDADVGEAEDGDGVGEADERRFKDADAVGEWEARADADVDALAD